MKTVTIQIGNSDDKLRQVEWARFVKDIASVVENCCDQIHFCGHSMGDAPWQNYCVVVECDDLARLRSLIAQAARKYRQDSIAMTVGDTVFIRPRKSLPCKHHVEDEPFCGIACRECYNGQNGESLGLCLDYEPKE